MVGDALNKGRSGDWSKRRFIQQTHDDHVIYEDGDTGTHYRVGYSITGGVVALADDHAEVVKDEPQFKPVAPATFSMDGEATETADGQYVQRYGTVFELGDYPDKAFSLDESEADSSLSAFTSAPNDLEHKDTILSHAEKRDASGAVIEPERRLLGHVMSLERVGKQLKGIVTIPKWLHAIHPEPIGVSLTFDRNKRVIGNALTLNPRIGTAQVAAAFTAFNAEAPDETPAPRIEARDQKTMTKTLLQQVAALFSKAAEDETPVDPKDAKIAELEAELAKRPTVVDGASFSADAELPRVEREAESIAARFVASGKAKPAERAAMVARFKQDILADNAGVTAFSFDGTVKQGSSLALSVAIYEAREPDPLLTNFTGSELREVPAQGAQGTVSPERFKELMMATDLGRQTLKDKN